MCSQLYHVVCVMCNVQYIYGLVAYKLKVWLELKTEMSAAALGTCGLEGICFCCFSFLCLLPIVITHADGSRVSKALIRLCDFVRLSVCLSAR